MEITTFKPGNTVIIELNNGYKHIGEVFSNNDSTIILSAGTILSNFTGIWAKYLPENRIISYNKIKSIEYLAPCDDLYGYYYSFKWF